MPDKKTLNQLRLEKEQAEAQLAQAQRRLTRLENRKQYYEKGKRAKRTHELCNIGGTVESLAPVFKGLPKQEMYELLETVFSLPAVQHALRSFVSRKEGAEHGLFHFTADQIKRSEGQSVVASASYRSGEKLHSTYYGEDSDYTRKKGVICSEILLPLHAPGEFADREILWNAVEHAEHGKKA